jgi:hypothetical protein
MRARLTTLLALYLIVLLPAALRAEAPRFAHGFVIYKKVPSDQPQHYGGTLYLGSTPGPVWLEYDVGQAKPFYLAQDLFVSEIKFGALFEADFTTPQHVAYCQGIQTQLTAAAKQSPLLASAAQAAIRAIQTEVDHYQNGSVRLKGKWIARAEFEAVRIAAEKARMDQIAASKAEDERLRKNKAETAAAMQVLQDNLTRPYTSTAAHYLVQQANFDAIITDTLAAVKARGTLPLVIPSSEPGFILLPQYRDAIPLLWQPGGGSTATATSGAMICTYDDRDHLILADIVLYLISDPTSHALLNGPEVQSMQKLLRRFDPQIFDNLPDVLAATRIKALLKDKVTTVKLTTTHLILPKFHVYYSVDFPVEYQQTQQQQFVLIQLRPLAP